MSTSHAPARPGQRVSSPMPTALGALTLLALSLGVVHSQLPPPPPCPRPPPPPPPPPSPPRPEDSVFLEFGSSLVPSQRGSGGDLIGNIYECTASFTLERFEMFATSAHREGLEPPSRTHGAQLSIVIHCLIAHFLASGAVNSSRPADLALCAACAKQPHVGI